MRSTEAGRAALAPGGEARTGDTCWAMGGLSLAMLLPALGTSIANVGLPTLTQAFGASFQDVQWVVLAYLLVITTLVVSAGRLGDLLGRRRLLVAGIFLYTFASALCAFAPTLGWLIAARALQGAGAALMMALTLAIASATVPPTQTGRAMGLLGTMSAIGTALGPSLGGALIAGYGWPALFLVGVPLGALTALLALRYLPSDQREGRPDLQGFDVTGTLFLALTLAAYALAMTAGGAPFGPLSLGLLSMAGLGFGLFANAERHAASPLIRLAMVRDRRLRAGFAISMVGAAVVMATMVVGPFHLAGAFGLDPARVGLVLTVGPLVAAIAGVPAGRLVDRFGAPRMTAIGLGVMTAGSLLLALPATLGIPGFVAPVAVLTAGYALVQAANNTAVMGGVTPAERGVVSGMLNLSRNLGLITGASLMGAVFAAASGSLDVGAARPGAVAAGMQATFALATALLLAALVLSGRRREVASPSPAGVAP